MAESQTRTMALGIWALITLGCIVLSGVAGVFAWRDDAERRDIAAWHPVRGTVIHTRSSTNPQNGVDSYWATLEYTDERGNRHEFEPPAASYPYDEETYEFFYDPENPDRAAWAPSGFSNLWILTGAMALFGLVFLGIGVKVIRAARRSGAS